MRSEVSRSVSTITATVLCVATVVSAQQTAAPRFRPDDPIALDDDRAVDAGTVARDRRGGWVDFFFNTLARADDQAAPRAANVNTLDEVADSSWFTNRRGAQALNVAAIVRGPDRFASLASREWLIVEGKDSGQQPGFRAVDPSDPTRQLYQIEFDSQSHPEMATGAEIIGTAIYHALGYNVVDVYLTDLSRESLRISPDATIAVNGRTRRFTRTDLDALLRRVARMKNGRYRALASRFAGGRNVGPFRYAGTRPDDPNDIYPHEHRRELRGNRVFAAWLNHDDSRSMNTLDMLDDRSGRWAITHYMFDFGSMLGSGTDGADHPWVGHEHVVDASPAWRTLLSLGLYRRPFIGVAAPSDMPAAGNFTADRFIPAEWKPHYPNPAFSRMRADDAFWAARMLAALTPEAIAAIVRKAHYSDARVTDYVTGTLIQRRAAALKTWLTGVNPIVDPRISGDRLVFSNAAVDAGVAAPEASYELRWFVFENAAQRHRFLGAGATASGTQAVVPDALRAGSEYIGVEVRTRHAQFASWRAPVRLYFRRALAGWTTVGLERLPMDISTPVATR